MSRGFYFTWSFRGPVHHAGPSSGAIPAFAPTRRLSSGNAGGSPPSGQTTACRCTTHSLPTPDQGSPRACDRAYRRFNAPRGSPPPRKGRISLDRLVRERTSRLPTYLEIRSRSARTLAFHYLHGILPRCRFRHSHLSPPIRGDPSTAGIQGLRPGDSPSGFYLEPPQDAAAGSLFSRLPFLFPGAYYHFSFVFVWQQSFLVFLLH